MKVLNEAFHTFCTSGVIFAEHLCDQTVGFASFAKDLATFNSKHLVALAVVGVI